MGVLPAWEIGLNDIERLVIRVDDKPLIPDNIIDPHYLEVIKTKLRIK